MAITLYVDSDMPRDNFVEAELRDMVNPLHCRPHLVSPPAAATEVQRDPRSPPGGRACLQNVCTVRRQISGHQPPPSRSGPLAAKRPARSGRRPRGRFVCCDPSMPLAVNLWTVN